MSDFELQRRLRAMNEARPPQNDLWSGIAARIAAEESAAATRHRRNGRLPFAAAAALLACVITGSLVLGLRGPGSELARQTGTHSALASSQKLRDFARDARESSRASMGDPRLIGAAVVLDSAHAELEQALELRPDAVFLVSLLNRTNARRMKLDHFGANAG
ncbi:MAG: hypothetical protein ABIR62_17800 [Dokdonella sp.]|uniref:hypothetical protein n=1 Tax=Dokdonella sp. TaxID=2291710 RepID=UPI003265CDC9